MWGRFTVRGGVVLSVLVIIIGLRFSTGSPSFKPVDNAASFAESTVTRVRQNNVIIDREYDLSYLQVWLCHHQVLSYNYIYAINAWLLVDPWWLCFDWSMGCIPLVESLLDGRLFAVLLFYTGLFSLSAFCMLGSSGPTKRYQNFIYFIKGFIMPHAK